jgi:D-galactonate transporter
VGFAQLQMKQQLGLSDSVYGFGAGLFFVGYFAFEVPSNLLLERFGARRWIARIMITWGLVSVGMMFVRGGLSFSALRLLLGFAEAGFFPGMILYLTYWFPTRERAQAIARFMTAIAVAGLVGSPISGLIMDRLHGASGLAGWQWLFLLEGLPSVLLGLVVLAVLPDGPAEVRWLDADEKRWLADALAAEQAQRRDGPRDAHSLRDALVDRRVWLLSLVYFAFACTLYGFGFWLPQVVKQLFAGTALETGLLTAIPYVVAAIAMVSWAAHSDRTGERRRHLVTSTFCAGAGLAASTALLDRPPIALAALCLAMASLFASFGPFWALATSFLRGRAAAGGIAVINSFGNLGGFVAPSVIGAVKQRTGGFTGGLLFVAATMLVASALVAIGTRARPAAT